MRAVSLIKGILLNICIICSMVCIALKVLDWYNPYMDFAGHAAFIPYTLYISVFLYAILEAFSGRSRQEDKRKKTQSVAVHRQYSVQSITGHEVTGKHRV